MMQPCAGLDLAPAWLELLAQEGVPTVPVRIDRLPASPRLLIVGRPLFGRDRDAVRAFLASGGAILGAARYLGPVLGIPVRPRRVRYLTDHREDSRCWLDLLDVERVCHIPREANLLRTEQGEAALFAGDWGGGSAVLLPFDPPDLWSDCSGRMRMFPTPFDRMPYEQVAKTGRADLLLLLHHSLEYLHHARGLAYARLWPFPGGAPTVVGFRLDTDRATRLQIDAFEELSRTVGLPFSWFVDVSSHEEWLDRFARMQGQEIGIHCRAHRTHATAARYREDILEARGLLENIGITPAGYAAPYGIWNPALGETLEELELPFSSEFGVGYDTFPFRPEVPGRRYGTLQVPVHPVSAGALRRAGFTAQRMIAYFRVVIQRKLQRCEPILLYDHPVHGYTMVAEAVLRLALAAGGRPVTLGSYAAWWQERERVLRAWNDGLPEESLAARAAAASVSVRVTQPNDREASSSCHHPANLRESRDFDLRTALGITLTLFNLRRRR